MRNFPVLSGHRFIILTAAAILLALTITAVAAAHIGSNFEGDDGNLVVNGSGTDWVDFSPPELKIGRDEVDSRTDDSFGKGTKEDDAVPGVGTGNSPKKNDLTRFYVAQDEVTVDGVNKDFLYLAWERASTDGTANIDFEFNQNLPDPALGNGVTPIRTHDDMLITYDFGSGGNVVDIGLSRWIDPEIPTGAEQCEAGITPPCWGPVQPLDPSVAEGHFNEVPVYEPFLSIDLDTDVTIPEKTFGEAVINLSDAGVFDPGVCTNFGSAYVKSRSSDSFTAVMKDFIAPIEVNVSNCGTITISTQTDPSDATGSSGYTLTDGDGIFLAPDITDGSTYTEFPGTYIITGDVLIEAEYDGDGALLEPGYDLTDITCETSGAGTSATPDPDNGTVDVTLAEDGEVNCTFTYTQRGSIIVEKQTLPDGDLETFDFTGDVLSGTISDGGTLAFYDLEAKARYTVTENVPAGWDLTDITCDDGNSASPSSGDVGTRTATFNVDPGETVTCTFTNTKRGSITIVKDAVPNEAQDFGYSSSSSTPTSIGSFSLDDDADGLLPNTRTFNNLKPGTYTVTENDPNLLSPKWDLTNLVCGAGGSDDLPSRTATIILPAGGSVTCTFTNTKRGNIIVAKETDPVGDAAFFGFTGDIAASLSDGQSSTPVEVVPGVHTVTEDDPTPAFDLTSIVCDDGNSATPSTWDVAARTATFNVEPGETVTCAFANTERGTITIIKDAQPDDPQNFKFSGFSSFNLDDDDDPTLSNTETLEYVAAGPHDVKEEVVKGKASGVWVLTNISCDDLNSSGDLGTRTAEINLEPGEHVTCTFTNEKRRGIVVEKQTIPDGASGSFTFTGDAPGTISDNGQIVVSELLGGSYTSTETDPASQDFDLTDISCDDGSSATPSTWDVPARTATFNTEPGETVTCVFTNTQRGYILVDKVTNVPTTQDFNFSLSGDPDLLALLPQGFITSFPLADADQPERIGPLPATVDRDSTWAISESALPAGWVLDRSECDNGSPVNAIVVPPGGVVTCTFYNEMQVHPGSAGFWRNWDNHYTERELALLLGYTGLTSDVTGSASASDTMQAIFDLSGGHTLEQKALLELVALELNLAATALSSSDEYAYLLRHDRIYPSCIVDPSGVTGESYFYRGALSISDLTVGEVVSRVEGSWSGSDPLTLDSGDWTFDLTTAWSFDQSDWAAGLTESEAYEAGLILIDQVLSGINQGYLLIPDPDTYPASPSCLQSDSYSLTGLDGLASLYDGTFDPSAFPGLPTSLAEGTVSAPYSATLQAGGGTPPYSWSFVDGERFPGMILNPDTGEISGTPTAAGTFIFTLQVTDGVATDSRKYSITINPLPVITTPTSLPSGTVGVAYNNGEAFALAVAGGTPGYTWAIISGNLPDLLSLDPSNGEISGMPIKKTRPSGMTFTVQVTDSSGATATKLFTIVINR